MSKKIKQRFVVQGLDLKDLTIFNNVDSAKEYAQNLKGQGRDTRIYIDQMGDLSAVQEIAID